MVIAMLPLLAVGGVLELPQSSTLVGWTADGQSLVWTTKDSSVSYPKHYYIERDGERVEVEDPSKLSAEEQANMEVEDEGDMGAADPITNETATIATVHDVRTGAEHKFLMSYKALTKDGAKNAELKKKYAGLGDAKAYEAWKRAHPFSKLAAGKKSKTGSVTISAVGGEATTAAWKGNTYSWNVPESVTVTLGTVCGKDKATETLQQEMGAMYEPNWSATPYWDPTGHRVLFQLKEAVAKTMRGEDGGNIQFVLVPCGPRVDVVAPAGLESATGKVADAVEKAGGFTVVSVGAAKAARTATVIYADDAHMEVAKKLVAAIPGGATVEKLTWKPKSNIVVAIGDSAK